MELLTDLLQIGGFLRSTLPSNLGVGTRESASSMGRDYYGAGLSLEGILDARRRLRNGSERFKGTSRFPSWSKHFKFVFRGLYCSTPSPAPKPDCFYPFPTSATSFGIFLNCRLQISYLIYDLVTSLADDRRRTDCFQHVNSDPDLGVASGPTQTR